VTIDSAAHEIENVPAEQNSATAHLFIINPLSGNGMDNIFYPSVERSTPHRCAAIDIAPRPLHETGRSALPSARRAC
jgi:heat shock protein HtpX